MASVKVAWLSQLYKASIPTQSWPIYLPITYPITVPYIPSSLIVGRHVQLALAVAIPDSLQLYCEGGTTLSIRIKASISVVPWISLSLGIISSP